MQHDLLHGSLRDLDLRSNFKIDLPRSKGTYFDASRREEHDGAIRNPLSFINQKLIAKNDPGRKCYLFQFDLTWRGQQ